MKIIDLLVKEQEDENHYQIRIFDKAAKYTVIGVTSKSILNHPDYKPRIQTMPQFDQHFSMLSDILSTNLTDNTKIVEKVE